MNENNSKKSSIAGTGVITGSLAVFLAMFMAITANSLALWADLTATFLDFISIFIAWKGFKRIESKIPQTFNYGKLESFLSLGMALFMYISFFCIILVALNRFRNPVPVQGFGVLLGIGLHLIFGFINGNLLKSTLKMEKKEKSPLLTTQRKIYTIKFSANLIMVFSLGLSFYFNQYLWAMYLDPIAASIIAFMILSNASKIFNHSSRDLLDYALEEQYQLLILRSLASHYDLYENVHDIRTRISGGRIYIEIFMEFNGDLKHHEIMKAIKSIKKEISNLVKCDEIIIVPVTEK